MAGVGEREHNRARGVVEGVQRLISGVAEAEVDGALVGAQGHGGAGGLEAGELLHQVPEIGGAGVQERGGRLPRSSGAPSGGLGISIGGTAVWEGRGIGAAVVELGPLIAGDRHV